MRAMRRHQAKAGVLLALASVSLALAGCEIPKEVNPVEIYRTVSGENDAGRPPPPGMDRARPSLGSVPPRPERPPPEVRDALSAALAMNRTESREPLPPRTVPAPPAAAAAPGDPPLPAAPPPRPSLAGAPVIPWGGPALRGRVPGSAAAPPAAAPAAVPGPVPGPVAPPAMPDLAPAPPPPDLLGPPRRP